MEREQSSISLVTRNANQYVPPVVASVPVNTTEEPLRHGQRPLPPEIEMLLATPPTLPACLQKLMVCFVQLTAKFPLVIMFLLIVLYAVPASAAVLLLYVLVTFLFALPSFLILYFAYPTLTGSREIFT
ncbi:hypothetical protein ZWY2020_041197 [Hordeum vulgare]|nr:hypothetical protein ZWY2020_041197 [Hordeum vulgare]